MIKNYNLSFNNSLKTAPKFCPSVPHWIPDIFKNIKLAITSGIKAGDEMVGVLWMLIGGKINNPELQMVKIVEILSQQHLNLSEDIAKSRMLLLRLWHWSNTLQWVFGRRTTADSYSRFNWELGCMMSSLFSEVSSFM